MNTKFRAGKFMIPGSIEEDNERYYIQFRYSKELIDEVKSLEGAKWNPDNKIWTAKKTSRNLFSLEYLMGGNPYKRYEESLIPYESTRPLFKHQIEMVQHCLTRKHCLLACEMGTGKTLVAIEVMEKSGHNDWWWIGPKSTFRSIKLELIKWGSKVFPFFITYESLTGLLERWDSGKPPPRGVVFDESSKIKTPNTKRSIASKHLADSMRKEHKDCFIIAMSGSPAPKSPLDWWHQCEVCCPGFLKERDLHQLRSRLAILKESQALTGAAFLQLIAWRDDGKKCNICGMPEHPLSDHAYEQSKNEVQLLHERMKGLVLVKMKKDCLDLPDKIYRIIKLDADPQILRIMKMIHAGSSRAVEELTLLRELSDGFQYRNNIIGSETCPNCQGSGIENEDICPRCNGAKIVEKVEQVILESPTPKDEETINILDEHNDVGRLVIYAGFTASIDKLVKLCHKQQWWTIRVDGRGWLFTDPDNNVQEEEPLAAFQSNDERKIVFIGQPGAAGMGLTLTKSPSILFYSNDFSAEHRIQAEDRIHRPGMDLNKGATIIDFDYLPTDMLVLDNLKKKRDLQSITLGEIDSLLGEKK